MVSIIFSGMIILLFSWLETGMIVLKPLSGLNTKVPNFSALIYLSLLFLVVSVTSLSVFLSLLPSYIKELEPLFKQDDDTISHGFLEWYQMFKKDIDYFSWQSIISYILLAIVLTIPHYLIWSKNVWNELGFDYWVVTSLIYWFMIGVALKFVWVLFAQFFHLYRFTLQENGDLYLGYSIPPNGWKSRFFEKAKDWDLLPINTLANKYKETIKDRSDGTVIENNHVIPGPVINIDIFNVDDLGGLSPLTNITTLGALLLGILFAISVPLLVIGLRINLALIFIVVSFFGIVGGFLYSISSVRDAIKTQKGVKLEKVNKKLSSITNEIISMEEAFDERIAENTQTLNNLMAQYHVYDEIGRKIKDVPESPRSLSAVLKVLTSSSLPLFSFGTIQQFDIISLFL